MAAPVKDSAWLEWIASLMGGASRQSYAAAFPPDYYWCLLDDLPLHLIPPGSLSSDRPDQKKKYIVNPHALILPEGQTPPAFHEDPYARNDNGLQRFALQGTIAWIPQTADSLLPFWLSSRLEDVLASVQNGTLPPGLKNADLSILIAAGLLQAADATEREHEYWRQIINRSAEMFQQRDYAPIRQLIHPFHVAALRRYFRYIIRSGMVRLGDEQSSRRYAVHNDPVAGFFHHHLASLVSAVVGQRVKPSYVYSVCYLSGAELKKHTDREQCEFSVTFCLDFAPEPAKETSWPIRLDTPRASVSVYQALGDGLVYRGTRVPHYRDVLPTGRTSTSIFFHYVPEGFTGSLD